MATELHVAPSLTLPKEAALQRNGILAMSGAGKSNTAVVMAEEMYAAGIPWVAIDPKGDWWGIRSSADGKEAGLAVPVFGGLEGDVPLEETGGKLMAELVADKRLTCVLDVSEFPSKAAQLRFLTDFATTLLRKNRAPLHVFAEEADEYLPQRVMKSEAVCVGAWTRLVKRGRFRGVFVTLITQRSAALNKDALSQLDSLIPMRVGDPRDKKAIKDWVVQHAIGQEMFDSLPFLEDGEAWIWSPQKLKLTERVTFRRRRTFDSGATPDWDERPPAKLADIDMSAFKDEMAATIERAEAQDPKKLQRRIRELESEVAKKVTVAEPEVLRVEVPVLPDGHADRLAELHEKVDRAAHDLLEVRAALQFLAEDAGKVPSETAQELADQITNFGAEGGRSSRPAVEAREPGAAPVRDRRESGGQRARRATPAARPTPPAAGSSSNGHLSGPQQRVLDAVAWLHEVGFDEPSKLQVGFIAGYRVGKKVGGTYGNVLGQLRAEGLIDYVQTNVVLTGEGRAVAAPPDIERTTTGLQAAVFARLNDPERRVLRGIIDAYPDALTKQDAGQRAGYTVGDKVGGTYGNILGRLRSLGLIDYHNGLVAAEPILFLD